jgi:hypothetical protein
MVKMKKLPWALLALTIGIFASLFLAGCAGTRIKRLSGTDFMMKAEAISQPSSFVWYHYIGTSYQRAYLEYGHPAFIGKGVSTTVYWTPLSELPTNVTSQLKAGNPPWTNWMIPVKVKP